MEGGSMTEWLERWTCYQLDSLSSSPAADGWLDLFLVVLSSNPQPHLQIANWFASYLSGFLTLLFVSLSLKSPIRGQDN